MKSISTLVIVLALAYMPARSQHEPPKAPSWLTGSGFWVVENNGRTPRHHILYFYNDAHVLIYKETIEGVKLNLQSARVKKKLKRILNKSLLAWQKHQQAKENEELAKNLLWGK